MHGEHIRRTEAHKDRKDDFIAFHFFVLKGIKIDDKILEVGVNVGERENKVFEYTVYELTHNDTQSWKKEPKEIHQRKRASLRKTLNLIPLYQEMKIMST